MKITSGGILTFVSVALCGCALEPIDSVAEHDDDGATATAEQEVLAGSQFAWNQGNPVTPMGDTSNGACFLSMMKGRFDGYESVHAHTSPGYWALGGLSQTAGVGAHARCAVGTYTNEFTWTSNNNYPVLLKPTSSHACFLTRARGEFRGWGDFVHVYESGGNWYLFGNANHSGVKAGARCIEKSSPSYVFAWGQNDGAPTPMGSTSEFSFCALTRIGGNFRSAQERVQVMLQGDSWYLGGASQQWGVHARAVCF